MPKKKFGEYVTKLISGLADWIGAGDAVRDLGKQIIGYDVKDEAELASKINRLANKLASDYQLDIEEIVSRASSLTGIPISNITKKAIGQERNKINNEKKARTTRYLNDSQQIDKASEMLNTYRNQDEVSKAFDTTLRDNASTIINAIEGGNN